MLRNLFSRAVPVEADIVLLHSALSRSEVIFGDELRRYAADGRLRLVELHTDTHGLLDVADLATIVPDLAERTTYACGPVGLLDALEEHHTDQGLPLHTERFRAAVVAAGEGGTLTFAVRRHRRGRRRHPDPRRRRGRRRPDAERLPDGHLLRLRAAAEARAPCATSATARSPSPSPGDGVIIQTCISAAAGAVRHRPLTHPLVEEVRQRRLEPRKGHAMTALQKKPVTPIDHLTPEDIEQLGIELDAIRQDILDDRGERDAKYIRTVIDVQRRIELASRAVLLFSAFPPAWIVGTAGLSVAKILENMEIGHNVLHGQWDWMRDPKIHSTTWEWDMATPAKQWKHSHNELHHTYTNVIGKDNDLGYGIMRVDEDQPWHPFYLVQPLWNFINACFFEYGIAAYDLELGANIKRKKTKDPEFKARVSQVLKKIRNQATKDYVVHPVLSIPTGSFLPTLAANFTANVVRNLWSHSIIMCGHFPEGVETFEKRSIEGETRGDWYLRQMLGSANISGCKAMHLMSGNLSHQIEHHLFPDLPSNRYAEIAPKVQALFEKYELNYHSAPFPQQLASAWHKVVRLSLPNGWLATTNAKNAPQQVALLYKMTTGGSKIRRAAQARLTQQARKLAA